MEVDCGGNAKLERAGHVCGAKRSDGQSLAVLHSNLVRDATEQEMAQIDEEVFGLETVCTRRGDVFTQHYGGTPRFRELGVVLGHRTKFRHVGVCRAGPVRWRGRRVWRFHKPEICWTGEQRRTP